MTAMEGTITVSPPLDGPVYTESLSRSKSHPSSLDDFVCGYLKGRGVDDDVAASIAQDAKTALRRMPYWYATASGRMEVILSLHLRLVERGHGSQISTISGDLVKELLKRRSGRPDQTSSR